MVFERKKQDIFELLEHATPDLEGFYKRAQVLVNNDDPYSPDVFLLEITPALADQLLAPTPGFSGCFKSVPHEKHEEPTFFCSPGQTYKLLETETSNSLLLLPSLKIPCEAPDSFWNVSEQCISTTKVTAIKDSYLELSSIGAPSLKRLKNVLITSLFTGHIEDEDQPSDASNRFYTYQDLLDCTPCSEQEFLIALDKLRVMSWKGYCRMFEVEYLNNVLQAIFDLADEHAWEWAKVGLPATSVVDYLSGLYPPEITRQVLQRFFYRRHGSPEIGKVFPRTGKICQLIGEHLLSVTNRFALRDFFAVWCSAVPHGMHPRLRKHLTCAGRAVLRYVTSMTGIGHSISLLRSEDLPDESVEARLEALFERQPAWPEVELAGFISDLVVGVESSSTSRPPLLPFNGETESTLAVLSDDDEEQEEEEDVAGDEAMFDEVKPVPAVLGTLLAHSCRVSSATTAKGGRTYTEKYSRI